MIDPAPDLVIPGLSRWLPLDLGADADEYVDRLIGEFPRTPGVDVVAPAVAGLAARFRTAQADAESDGDVLVAAWLLLLADDDLRPLAHATLHGIAVPADHQSVEDVRRMLVADDDPVYGRVTVRELPTASGVAHLLRYRPIVEIEGEQEVHERTAVAWLRPERDLVVLLTGYSDDLVAAWELPEAVEQLARGVQGV